MLDKYQTAVVDDVNNPRNAHNLRVAAGAGSGKCVVGDTLVAVPSGTRRIAACEGIDEIKWATNTETLARVYSAPAQWLDTGTSRVLEVELRSGIRLRGTPEHPLLQWNGAPTWTRLDALSEGDCLLLMSGYAVKTGTTSVDPEEAYLLGLWVGDGWSNRKSLFWSRGGDFLPPVFFSHALQFWGLGGWQTHVKPGTNSVTHTKGSVATIKRLQDQGMHFPGGARTKHLPDWLIAATDAERIRFLQGLFDTDGTASGGRCVELASASEVLARQVQQMLLGLGVVTHLRPKQVKGYNHTYWRILISGTAARVFRSVIGFRFERSKTAALDKLLARPSNPNVGVYPHVAALLCDVREEWKQQGRWNKKARALDDGVCIKDYLNGKRRPSRARLLALVEGCTSPAAQRLRRLTAFYPDTVVAVRTVPGEHRVYDFHVPELHSFIANGIVSHNTRTLIEAVAQLVETGASRAELIYLTTFTAKAAKEMQARLKIRIGWLPEVHVGTFHALALRALRVENRSVWNHAYCLDTANMKSRVPPGRWLWYDVLGWGKIRGSGDKGLDRIDADPKEYALAIDVLRSRGLKPGKRGAQKAADATGLPGLYSAWKLYDRAKTALNAWDFADVLDEFAVLLAKKQIAPMPLHVFVDEAQDNSLVQLMIAKDLAAKGRLYLIGDPRQAIFGWRGAYPAFFQDVETHVPNTKTLSLPSNYRSGKLIVSLGNAIADGEPWSVGDASLTIRETQGRITVWPAHPDVEAEENAGLEADTVASQIAEALTNGAEPSDFAILVRTNVAAGPFELSLIAREIPTAVVGRSFFSNAAIQDCLAYCLLTHGEYLNALERIANKPKRFLSKKVIGAAVDLMRTGAAVSPALREAAKLGKRGARKGADELATLLTELRMMPWPEPARVIAKILREAAKKKLPENVQDATDDKLRVYDVFEEIAGRFESAQALETYIDHCVDAIHASRHGDDIINRVVISTVHKFKGLEANNVYVNVPDGVFPHARCEGDLDRLAEELRLFYVACTRARDSLTLTHGGKPSVFVDYADLVDVGDGLADPEPKPEPTEPEPTEAEPAKPTAP